MQLLAFEIGGAALVLIAVAMMWIARPVDGKPALFLRRRESIEVGYALLILFTLASGMGGILLGLTT